MKPSDEHILQYFMNTFSKDVPPFSSVKINVSDDAQPLSAMATIHKLLSSDPLYGKNPVNIGAYTETVYLTQRWMIHKNIYRIDSDFCNALMDTEDCPIHTEMFKRLPYKTIALTNLLPLFKSLNLKDDECYDLAVADYRVDKNGECTIWVALGIEENGNVFHASYTFSIEDNDTVSDVVNSYSNFVRDAQNGTIFAKGSEYDRVKEHFKANQDTIDNGSFRMLCKLFVLIGYYLSSKKPDVEAVHVKKSKRPKINGKRIVIDEWNVGFREGAVFRTNSKTDNRQKRPMIEVANGEVDTFSNHHGVRPHTRRAHWHHYWTGVGRSTLELRWINATFVNKPTEETFIPAVHHCVDREGENLL